MPSHRGKNPSRTQVQDGLRKVAACLGTYALRLVESGTPVGDVCRQLGVRVW